MTRKRRVWRMSRSIAMKKSGFHAKRRRHSSRRSSFAGSFVRYSLSSSSQLLWGFDSLLRKHTHGVTAKNDKDSIPYGGPFNRNLSKHIDCLSLADFVRLFSSFAISQGLPAEECVFITAQQRETSYKKEKTIEAFAAFSRFTAPLLRTRLPVV